MEALAGLPTLGVSKRLSRPGEGAGRPTTNRRPLKNGNLANLAEFTSQVMSRQVSGLASR
jgi:hypothetical protein